MAEQIRQFFRKENLAIYMMKLHLSPIYARAKKERPHFNRRLFCRLDANVEIKE